MKNKIIAFVLILLISGLALMIPGIMENTTTTADEAEWSQEGSDDFYGFTVVEIVPYKGMGEIGYLVGGQEPIDGSLIPYQEGAGKVSFLGGAISTYCNLVEQPMPASGNANQGWIPGISYTAENGYFEKVSSNIPDSYSMSSNQTIYERVTNGTGTHIARLPDNAVMDNIHESWWYPENYRNVNAYFVSDRPADQSLTFSQAYKAFHVTRKEDRTGDYDYNTVTKRFYLNRGKGLYEVIFVQNNDTYNNPSYYMLKDYELVPEGTGDYSYSGAINYVAQAGGNYKRTTGALLFTYAGSTSNNYRWVKDDTALTKANFTQEGNRIWVKGQRIRRTYQFRRFTSYVNNEFFKRYSLGVPADQVDRYPVRVLTLTPNDLNGAYQYIIDEANLFYINENSNHNQYIEYYENYNPQGILQNPKYANNRGALSFAYNDLNWDTTVKLFKKIAGIGCHKAAVIVDSLYYQDAVKGANAYNHYHRSNINVGVTYNNNGATSVNMAKLYIMITQRNMVDFYNSFLNPDLPGARLITRHPATGTATGISPTGTTGSFVRPGSNYSPSSNTAIYWNGNTFLPFGLNADGVMTTYRSAAELYAAGVYNLDLTAQTTDLAKNVLILNGQDIFTDKFVEGIPVPGNQNEGDHWDEAEEHLRGLDPSGTIPLPFIIGNLVNVITNNGNGYGKIGGEGYPGGSYVEGPPSTEHPGTIPEDGSDGSNLRSYKRVLNIQPTAYFAQSETNIRNMLADFEVQIISMTSMEFNSKIEDINSKYDVIYIGSNVYNNKSRNRFHTSTSGSNVTTAFNDSTMNAYVYSARGDQTELALGSNVTQVRYRGNDLTTQKVSELKAFLNAGYPIVLENNLYQISNGIGSTAKVDPASNIYSFINDNKSSYLNLMNYAAFEEGNATVKGLFLIRLKSYMNILRPAVSLVEPVIPAGAAKNYVQVDPVTDQLRIKFKLLPKNGVPSVHTYNAYLYLDKNGDGIFEASEDLDARAADGSRLFNLRESNNRTYICTVNMSALNGGYQWKLVVERTSNPLIRSNISGYASVANGKELYILQITDSATASYRLSEKIVDTNRLIYAYAGAGKLSDYNLNFETITVGEYQAMFTEASKYDPTKPLATSRLSKYHLLILDNPVDQLTDQYGSVRNIRDEIANHKLGVIFTKDALGYSNQDQYYSTASRSFLNNGTDRAYTYHYINRNFSSNAISSGYRYIYKDMVGNNHSADKTKDLSYRTNHLTKTNDGTITHYPYKISRAIRIADNFYSKDAVIDYNLARGERLIGWYSLSDTRSPVVREVLGLSGTTESQYQGMYSSSPNDVKNNYYLFSNGSTYYSGIRLAEADITGNDNEMKLFVNTILACHKATWNRVVSNPPEIEIRDPLPQLQPDNTMKITVQPDDLVGTDFILQFRINQSSSNMDLEINYNDMTEPDGITWDNYVYPVNETGNLGSAIAINHTSKVIQRDTLYAIKIPADQLTGLNKLTLIAKNLEGNSDTEVVYLEFVQPPLVTILDPIPPAGVTLQHIYVDLDYSPDAPNEDYLAGGTPVRIVFQVESIQEYTLDYTSDGESLMDGGADDVTVSMLTATPPGASVIIRTYELLVPASFIQNRNSRDLTITATYGGLAGEVTVRILRRSLFPLD